MKLLHIDSSILADGSVSRGLTADLVAQLQAQHPDAAVTYRDLGASPIGHLSGAHLAAGAGVVPESVAVQDDVSAGQAALAEFLAADVIVVGAPMYNFGIPSQLKAWIDRLAVAGQTFRYTEKGVEGLAGGKTLYVVSSRGGFYAGTPMAAMDHQEAYLSAVFGFFGITDVRFIRAEGIAMGPEPRATAVAKAQHEIAAFAA